MHALAGTIGYELIHDEEARQAAKQASRERTFGRASDLGIGHRVIVVDDPTIGGTSTPSTAASPYDAEAALARVRKVLDGLEHEARQYRELGLTLDREGHSALARRRFGQADGITIAVEELRGALR